MEFAAIAASLWCFLASFVDGVLPPVITGGIFLPRFLHFRTTCYVVPSFVALAAPYGSVPTHFVFPSLELLIIFYHLIKGGNIFSGVAA